VSTKVIGRLPTTQNSDNALFVNEAFESFPNETWICLMVFIHVMCGIKSSTQRREYIVASKFTIALHCKHFFFLSSFYVSNFDDIENLNQHHQRLIIDDVKLKAKSYTFLSTACVVWGQLCFNIWNVC